jgi:small subunit ribosomal protein S8
MLDPIADMLTRIRNAQRAFHKEVVIPSSKLKLSIAKIFQKEGFIKSVDIEDIDNLPHMRIELKYEKVSQTQENPAIREIKRVSREGQRIYVRKEDIKKVKNGYGIAVVSTSKGVMTGTDAYRQGLGGEYLCEVW